MQVSVVQIKGLYKDLGMYDVCLRLIFGGGFRAFNEGFAAFSGRAFWVYLRRIETE